MNNLTEYEQSLVKWLRRTRPTIHVFCRHVSSSGMFRRLSFYAVRGSEPICLDFLISKMANYQQDKHKDGLRVSGCGMDMGFSVVYAFSHAIFPKGFKYRKDEPHRNGDPSPVDTDGGYALKHNWL